MVDDERWSGQRVTRQLRALRFDAGSPALNLVATVGRRGSRPIERLVGGEELAAWLRGLRLPVELGSSDSTFLVELRGLREAMDELLSAVMARGAPTRAAVELINGLALPPVPPPALVVGEDRSSVAVDWSHGLTGPEVLSLLARDLLHDLADPRWRARLCVCTAADCRMFYLDNSQGRRRQWCSMQHCGNRMKAAKRRAQSGGGVL